MKLRPLRPARIVWLLLGAVQLCGAGLVGAEENGDEPPRTIRVMSANVRYGTADDGDDRWDLRKDLLANVLRAADADLIGTQEMLPMQAQYLSEQLDQFTYVGRSREPDNEDGEQCGIFYRPDRFIEIERGSFWLSERPEFPGTRGWDAALPRMVSWLKLFDRDAERNLVFVNTHFDHRGRQARDRSAALVRQFVLKLGADYPLIATGDFNAGEASAPYQTLLDESDSGESPLVDVFRRIHPQRSEDEGTFNGFRGRQSGPRIDWILASRDWKVLSADIVRTSRDGRYPSDHFPVVAELQY